MKKIAILRCLRSNDVCTGAACMQAFNKRIGAFARYGDEALELAAYWSCNGCGDCHLNNQQGMEEKLRCIINMQVDIVHVGICTMQRTSAGKRVRCQKIVELCERLQKVGIEIVAGTH